LLYRSRATGSKAKRSWRSRILEADITIEREGIPTVYAPLLEELSCDGFDLQAAVIRHLFDVSFPIVSIVHSGNKSLHVWVDGKDTPESAIDSFISGTSRLGIDAKAGRTKSQFFRLPNPDHPQRKQYLLYARV